MRSTIKGLLAATALATVAITMSACEVPEDGASAAPSAAEKKNAVAVKAKTILREFEGNEAAADAKYDGKTLRITGVVDKVDTEILDDEEYVIQLAEGGRWVMWTVNCDDQPAKVAAGIKKGQNLTVTGKFEDGGDLGIELEGCEIAA